MSKKDLYPLYKILVLIFSFIMMLISCDKDQYIRTYRLPKNNFVKEIPNNFGSKNLELGWEKPKDWKEVDGHSMRLASFSAPYSEGYGDISITTFSGESGGIGPNVNRWLGQIGLEPMSEFDIDLISIKKVGLLGEYSYFKLLNDADNSIAILASIFQLKHRTIFVKLSCTLTGLKEIELDFLKFCNSIHQKN